MAGKKELFGTYFVKKFIIEVKHKPNLLHNEKVPEILNDMMVDFNKVTLIDDSKNKVFQIVNIDDYFLINSDWTKISTIYENVKDYESACQRAKKNIVTYLTKLKLSSITRLGFRTLYLLPFSGAFDELISYFKNKFYNNMSIYEPFGTIEDVGISLDIKDSQFKGNLSFGPMTKEEVKSKLSEFKKYDKDLETNLLIDLDLYNDTSPIPTVNAFIDNAYNASRIKVLKFREYLNN